MTIKLPDGLRVHVRIHKDGTVENMLDEGLARMDLIEEYTPLLEAVAEASGEPRAGVVLVGGKVAAWGHFVQDTDALRPTFNAPSIVLSPDACSALDTPKDP